MSLHRCGKFPRPFRSIRRGLIAANLVLAMVGALSAQWAEGTESSSPPLPSGSYEGMLFQLMESHPSVAQYKMRQSAQEARATFRDFVYPDPEVKVTTGKSDQTQAGYPTTYQNKRSQSYEVQVTQPIPFPGKLTAEANVQEYRANEARYMYQLGLNRSIARMLALISSYHRSNASLRLTQELAGAAGALEGIARARYGAGTGSLSDVSLARVQADTYREKVAMFKGDRDAAMDQLRYFADEEGRLQKFLEESSFRKYLSSVADRTYTLEELPVVQRIKAVQDQSESADTLARLQYLPDMGVFASYGKENMDLLYPVGSGKQTTYKFGVQLKVPLWSGLSNHKNVEAADKERKATSLQQLDVKNEIQARIASLSQKIEEGRNRLAIFQNRLVPNAWTARRSSVLAYQGGSADFTSVIQAWNAYYEVNIQKLALQEQLDQWIIERCEMTATFIRGNKQ